MKQKFCPKCRSTNVQPTTDYMDIIGGFNHWRCNECGFKLRDFPEKELKIKIKRHKK